MTTTLRASDLAIFDGLSIVRLDGFEPVEGKVQVQLESGEWVPDCSGRIDLPGSANWLLDEYGMQPDEFDPRQRGVIWTDLDNTGWKFSVLIASDEVEDFVKLATEAGYEIEDVEPISEPTTYGDSHAGIVTILQHPVGWVIAR
jgi:hypothetical protein